MLDQTRNDPERSLNAYLSSRLDAARDLYLLALGIGQRGPHEFGILIQEAKLHFVNVIEEARNAGFDTIDIQNLLANHNVDVMDTIRPELRDRLESLLREFANPR